MDQLKKMLFLLLILIQLFFPVQNALAADSNLPDGFVIGTEEGIKVSKDGAYFFNLADLQPGDLVTRNLVIENSLAEAYELKLTIKEKSSKGKVNLIQNMTMEIFIDGKEIYQGNLSKDGKGRNEVIFGTIPAHSKQKSEIRLAMKEQIKDWNNLYYSGESEAVIDWVFTAAHDKKKTGSPSSKESSNSLKKLLPKTGESISYTLAVLGILLFVTVCFIYVRKIDRRM